MAVPFNIPEGQNEVEVLLVQIQTLLTRLQCALRRNQQLSQQQQQQPIPSTSSNSSDIQVQDPPSSRIRTRESTESAPAASAAPQNSHSDFLSNLSWLAASASGASGSSSPLTAISIRSPRRRTSSESSYCDETKISITAIVKHGHHAQDWNKIDAVDSKESKSLSPNGILSKIMPTTISSCSLMTAMICFVGWHIFRAR